VLLIRQLGLVSATKASRPTGTPGTPKPAAPAEAKQGIRYVVAPPHNSHRVGASGDAATRIIVGLTLPKAQMGPHPS